MKKKDKQKRSISTITDDQIQRFRKESFRVDPNNISAKIGSPVDELIATGSNEMKRFNFQLPDEAVEAMPGPAFETTKEEYYRINHNENPYAEENETFLKRVKNIEDKSK